MASIACLSPSPNAAVIAIARRIDGNASTTSTTRMSASSTRPPAYPATAPTMPPTTVATTITPSAAGIEMRAP